MRFYPLFISLTCEKACEINLQADIFIGILVLCQRFIQTTASWDGPLRKLIPAPRQIDKVEGYAKDCLHHSARLASPFPHTQPLPADTAEDSAMKPGNNNRDLKAKTCSPGFCHHTSHRSYTSPGREQRKFYWMVTFTFDARPISFLWRVTLKPARIGMKLHHQNSELLLFKRKNSFFRLQHRQGKNDGLLHKAYPFTIHLYKPRTASSLFITWLHSSSIAGNHYHSMITKNNI